MSPISTIDAEDVLSGPVTATSDELPEGWAWASLEQLAADMSNGFGKREQAAGKPHFVLRLADLQGGELTFNGARRINATAAQVDQYGLQPDDLLFVRVNGSADVVGRVARFPGGGETALYCDHFVRVRPLLRQFAWTIRTYCDTPAARDFVEQNKVSSAGQNTISQASLRLLQIPLPPLAEQERIAAKVGAVLARVDAARRRLAKVPAVLKRFRQSVLAAACSGRLTEDWREGQDLASYGELPATWTSVLAGTMYTEACYGTSTKCDRNEALTPVLRVPNIAKGVLDLKDMKFGSVTGRELSKLTLIPGDLVICRTNGSLDLIGKAAIVPPLPRPHAFASYLIRVRLHVAGVLPEYFHAFLSGPVGRDQIEAEARTTAGQFNLNLEILRGLQLPLPPLPEQHEVVRRVSALFALADKVEARLSAATAAADRITRAVLAKAFRGELVETEAARARREGRDYEPAAKLLKRVCVDKGASPARSRQRPSKE